MAWPDDANPSRPGSINGAPDFLALFLKKFSGEIITEFEEACLLKPFITLRTLTGARSAQFPVIGGAAAKYHTPGDNILGDTGAYLNQILHNEKIIYADKKLLAATMIDEWDELINHYELRSAYARELAEALAIEFDYNVLKNLDRGSRASANITGGDAGKRIEVDSEAWTDISAGLVAAAKELDEHFVPQSNRWAVLSPTAYYNAIAAKDVINTDYVDRGNGSLAKGTVKQYMGINLLSSAHMATARQNWTAVTNQPNGAGTGNVYVTNMLTTWAFVWHPSAIGAVRVQDLTFEAEYKTEFQAHLMVAKYIMGMGILRPECCVALANDA